MTLKRLLTSGASCALACAISLPVSANPFEKTLSNGLRVIVQEDRRAPIAVHMVWYRVGSIDEIDGSSGLAHALEHMMFKGTHKLKPGEFSNRVAAAGGRDNAFTNYDYTAYFQQVPKARLGEMMALEADRMANLVVDPKEFAKEIKVVMEERRLRTDDQPQNLVYETLMATALQTHPYRRPVIGWMGDLQHMTARDAADWHQHWYSPNNAYVVIVGDVHKDEVFRIAEKTYGRVKPKPLPERKHLAEPEQKGERRVIVKAPAKLPYVALAYKVPKLTDAHKDREPYALTVLSAVLDGHEASRFARNLVRGSKVAVSASAGYDSTTRGESFFLLDASPAPGRSAAEIEAALRAEVARVASDGISEEELKRVKTQAIAAQVFKRDSMFAQAMEIGRVESAGFTWHDLDTMLDGIRRVSADEVRAVAAKYFGSDQMTVAVLDPQPVDGAKPAAGNPAAIHTKR